MNCAEYICKILEELGTNYVFGLFGDIQTDFAHAVRKSRLKWIGVHNEKSGGFMADIYARVTGKPGIIFTTLGPGATNLTSALANANQDHSPLIAISDQVPLKDFNLETHQYIDLFKAFNPKTGITKYAAIIKNISDIPRIIRKAFEISQTEPKGSVHISIPADIFCKEMNRRYKNKNIQINKINNYPKNTFSYKDLLKILTSGKKGLIIVGGPVERANARIEFSEFVKRFNLPVLTTFRGKNAINSDHPCNLGTISRYIAESIKTIINESDFILTIGYEYNEGVKPSLWSSRADKVININSYDNRIKNIFNPPSLFADLSELFTKLNKEPIKINTEKRNFQNTKKKLNIIIRKALDIEDKKYHPGRIIDAINRVFKNNSIIVCDIGLNKYYSGLLLKSSPSRKVIFSNGQSSMAFTSGVMGAKLADPKKQVIALVGDGGFLMNPQELLTAVKYKQKIIWIIFNNGGLGLIEEAQRKNGPKVHGVKFGNVFFEKLAESFGIDGIKINIGQDLCPILEKIKQNNKSAIIDVPVKYNVSRRKII